MSTITFWLTRVKKGNVKMTKPSVIFFGPDGVGNDHKKIFIRTLLYSTSLRGVYIQNMHIKLIGKSLNQIFNIWIYDDNGLVRGSGLFIDKSGISSNHHFLLPKSNSNFKFIEGNYDLEIYVEVVDRKPKKIYEQKLHLTKDQSDEINNNSAGVYFDWTPNMQAYQSHIDRRPKVDEKIDDYLKFLTLTKPEK